MDQVAERSWEYQRYWMPPRLSAGEMTALLKRMGISSFHEYVVGQMTGHFGRRTFLPTDRQTVVNTLRQDFPSEVAGILRVAEQTAAGKFAVLGSDLVDMRRGSRRPGWCIDWRRDPISNQRYARVFSQWRFQPDRMQPGRADIKGPWEMGRCQHLPTLGVAWWLTSDERYAKCFARTVSDFRRQNPVGQGAQWACPMDVSLRLVSWIIGASCFQGARPLGFRWWAGFLRGLVEHGRFIAQNLEYGTFNGELITSNHHLSNLLGLYWLAVSFPHLDAACVWRGIAERGLEQEIDRQILSDGGNYESSVPYHRLDVEMFLSAYAMSKNFGQPLSSAYRDRLLTGMEFLAALRQPGGRQPQMGDADNGRAHILTGYGRWNQESMDHLLAAGAAVLEAPHLAAEIPLERQVEAIVWGHTPQAAPRVAPRTKGKLYRESGLAVWRGAENYLLLANGRVGTSGVGNHKHNDQLAIEWVAGSQPLVVDGGSYCYTSDPTFRNLFRSVTTHNTVSVDAEEQHSMRNDWLFRLTQEGDASVRIERGTEERWGIEGTHTAYERLGRPVRHTRRVLFLADETMVLDDCFEGADEHQLRWYFLLYPGVKAQVAGSQVKLTGSHGGGTLRTPVEQRWSLVEGWYSPGYGQKIATHALFAERHDGPARVTTVLARAGLDRMTVEEAQRMADDFWRTTLVEPALAA